MSLNLSVKAFAFNAQWRQNRKNILVRSKLQENTLYQTLYLLKLQMNDSDCPLKYEAYVLC